MVTIFAWLDNDRIRHALHVAPSTSRADVLAKISALGPPARHGKPPPLEVFLLDDNLEALLVFYQQGLGFTVLYRFEDHDGFDGVMLGHSCAPYHFEFTHARGHTAGSTRRRKSSARSSRYSPIWASRYTAAERSSRTS